MMKKITYVLLISVMAGYVVMPALIVSADVSGVSGADIPGGAHRPWLIPEYVGSLPAVDPSTPTPANVLCVYNKNSATSSAVCSYYASRRSKPGQAVNVLGLDIPDNAYMANTGFTLYGGPYETADAKEDMSFANFYTYIEQPLSAYIAAHPELQITHLAVAKDLPIRVIGVSHETWGNYHSDGSASIFFESKFDQNTTFDNVLDTWATTTMQDCVKPFQHFNAALCPAGPGGSKLQYAVSYLTGQNLDDIREMIDKAQAPAPDLTKDTWLVDLNDQQPGRSLSEIGYSRYLSRVYQPEVPWLANIIQYFGIDSSRISARASNLIPLNVSNEIVAYAGMGAWHDGYGSLWLTQQPKVLAPVGNRAIIDVYESFFGYSSLPDDKITLGQSTIAQAFQPDAFGGSGYSRSFSGGVGTVDEPTTGGLTYFSYMFASYASGMTFAESALFSSSLMGIAVGDPIMKLRDSAAPSAPASFPSPTNVTSSATTGCTYPKINGIVQKQADGTYLGKAEGNIQLTWQLPQSPLVPSRAVITVDGNKTYAPANAPSFTLGGDIINDLGLATGTHDISIGLDYDAVTSNPVHVTVTIPDKTCHVYPTNSFASSGAADAGAPVSSNQSPVSSMVTAPTANSLAVVAQNSQPLYCHDFTTNLAPGSYSLEVRALHIALEHQGLLVPNPYSQSFVSTTGDQVRKFQARYGIAQVGTVGPTTRRKLNSLYGCSNRAVPNDVRPTTGTGAASQSLTASQPVQTISLGVIGSDSVLSREVAAGTLQTLGGFDVTSCGDSITVPDMHFGMTVKKPLASIGSGQLDPITGLVLTDANGMVLAGPVTSVQQGYGRYYIFDFGPVTFPQGSNTYIVKGVLPTTLPEGTILGVATYPHFGWLNSVSQASKSNVAIPDYGIVRSNAVTVGSVTDMSGIVTSGTVVGRTCSLLTSDLGQGSTGPNVAALQAVLIANGFVIPGAVLGQAHAADAYFGPRTAAALKKFQMSTGILTTGYLNSMTRDKINAIAAGQLSISPINGLPDQTDQTASPATPTLSPSFSPSFTAVSSPSASPQASATPSPTYYPTYSPIYSPTSSASPSSTASPTPTSSPSPSPTPTASPLIKSYTSPTPSSSPGAMFSDVNMNMASALHAFLRLLGI